MRDFLIAPVPGHSIIVPFSKKAYKKVCHVHVCSKRTLKYVVLSSCLVKETI